MTKKLQRPSTLIATCRTSYLVSAYEYFAPSKYKDDFIFLLAYCTLRFCDLDLNTMKQLFNNNPWAYQQLRLFTKNNFLFSDERSLEDVGNFLRLFNMSIIRYEQTETSCLMDSIKKQLSLNKVVIVAINEFHNPHNPNYFHKGYNKHYLAIQSMNSKEKTVEIIDTEQPVPYQFSFDDLIKAFENSWYAISCEQYKYQVNLQDIFHQYQNHHCDNQYLDKFYTRLKYDLSAVEPIEKDYFLRGYLFCITYQIIPVAKLRLILFQRLYSLSPTTNHFIMLLEELYQEWDNIRLSFVKSVYINQVSAKLLHRIYALIEKEKAISKSIKNLTI